MHVLLIYKKSATGSQPPHGNSKSINNYFTVTQIFVIIRKNQGPLLSIESDAMTGKECGRS